MIGIPGFGAFTGWLGGLLSGLGNVFINFLSWLWSQAVGVINWLIGLIPHLPLWPGPSTYPAISYLLSELTYQLNTWNYYIAINLWIVLWATAITFEALGAAFKALRWAISHLPFVGGD